MIGSLKLRQTTLKVITDVSAAGFEAAVNDWLKGTTEEELVSIEFTATDNGTTERFTAYIVYTK